MFVLTRNNFHHDVFGNEPHHHDVSYYVLFSTEIDANQGSCQWFFEYLKRLMDNTHDKKPENVILVNDAKEIVI